MRLPDRLENGQFPTYGGPWGHPLGYFDGEDHVLCAVCASKPQEIPQFRPVSVFINWEDMSLKCDKCSERIACAYPQEDRDTDEED